MDNLPAQASSVPAEHVFSSSAETDTWRQNHISPELMEQLQMLKYMLRKERLDFTGCWKCDQNELEQENEYEDQGLSVISGNVHDNWDLVDEFTDEGYSQPEDTDA